MKEIDLKWLKRIEKVHDTLSRSVPIGAPSRRCTKEILLDRYFKFLGGRAFKLRIPTTESSYCKEEDIKYEVFYALFVKTKHTTIHPEEGDELYHYSYGVRKHLGWNDSEYNISFRDEKLKLQDFKFHWNDILRITYEEIPVKEYWEVVKLFIDFEPKKELVYE